MIFFWNTEREEHAEIFPVQRSLLPPWSCIGEIVQYPMPVTLRYSARAMSRSDLACGKLGGTTGSQHTRPFVGMGVFFIFSRQSDGSKPSSRLLAMIRTWKAFSDIQRGRCKLKFSQYWKAFYHLGAALGNMKKYPMPATLRYSARAICRHMPC
ncbi:hypothetical protein FIU87_18990 [Bacillus sp. THAF10]|nr:hypothetical protein FIU87_18990 [Bacillus sp. THAF10]